MFTALILSLALVCAQDPAATAQDQPAELPIVLAGSGGFGFAKSQDGARLNLQIDEPGEVTLSLETIYFNPVVSVVDGQGRTLALDRDSGSGANAWLTLEVKPFVTYELVVGVENDGGRGPFYLEVHKGRVAPPEETETAWFVRIFSLFAEHQRDQGSPRKAADLYFSAAAYRAAEYALAMEPLRQTIELGKELGIPAYEVACIALLGVCERHVGDVEAGVALLEEAWERRAEAPNAQADCLVREHLGEIHADKREYAEALGHFDAWAEIAADAALPQFEALAHARRARTHERLVDREAAGVAHDQALALLDAFEDPYIESQILLAVGQFLNGGDHYDEAADVLQRAASVVEASGELITWEVDLLIQVELGEVQVWRGRYGAARQCLERATRLLGARADRRFELRLQISLCSLAERTGELYEARRLAELVIENARERDDLPLLMAMTRKLGSIQERLGDFRAAENAYEEAIGYAGGLDRPELEWEVLFAQGRLLRKQGRHDKALDLYMLALERAERIDSQSAEANCLNGIAYTLTFMGDREGALEQARDGAVGALAIWDDAGAPDEALVGPLHTLAVIALAEQDLDEVDRLLDRADQIIDREDVAGLARDDAAGVRSGFTEWGEIAQDSVARRLEDADADRVPLIAEGFDRASRWKARALLEGMPAAAVPRDRLGVLRDALGPERVLIEYASGAENLYAYVLDGNGLTRVDLGPGTGLDEQVDEFLSGMTQLDSLATAEEIAERGGALHELMLAPVLASLDGSVNGLVIVPTPELARVPFEALVMAADDPRSAALGFDAIDFVADRYHVTYGPSSPVLARLDTLGPRRTPGRALVMGDPWYASEADSVATARDPRTTATPSYDRLPATKAEVVDIAEAFLVSETRQDDEIKEDMVELVALKRARSGALESRRFDLYVGEAATADRLERDLREYEVLHIAAHGEVDPEDPLRTGLIFSFDGNVHGYVTLLDILDMQLDANLVVLSACETASGRILKGEGVQSMAQAFLQAGSRAVVASLWSVDDQATRATMSQFYESILLGERSGAEALRDAKNLDELKRNVRHHGNARGEGVHAPSTSNVGHPYYWAPFIYVGAIP